METCERCGRPTSPPSIDNPCRPRATRVSDPTVCSATTGQNECVWWSIPDPLCEHVRAAYVRGLREGVGVAKAGVRVASIHIDRVADGATMNVGVDWTDVDAEIDARAK